MYRQSITRPLTKLRCAKYLRPSSKCYQVRGNAKTPSATIKRELFALSYPKLLAGTLMIYGIYTIYGYQNRKLRPDTKTFLPFVLQSKDSVSSTSSIFTLAADFASTDDDDYSNVWDQGIWSVQVKQPQLQIARSYTPLPPIHVDEDKDKNRTKHLRFLIRQEPQGEVSSYIHNLPLGASISLRGPHLEYVIPQDVDEVLFIAGGTGIAPGLQAVYTLLEYREPVRSNLKIHILWANRRKDEVPSAISNTVNLSTSGFSMWRTLFGASPLSVRDDSLPEPLQASLVEEIEIMKSRYKEKLIVDYFIDEDGSYITENVLKRCLTNLKNTASENEENSPLGRKLVLISGPEGFIKHFAGPKVWAGGRETQGSLGGVLKAINPNHWEVWKL